METEWIIDPAHSSVFFKVKHMVISTLTGEFRDFTASIKLKGEDFSEAQFNFSAKTDSIDTKSETRDKHLKSEDFFDVQKYPELTFISDTGIQNEKLSGILTLKGISNKIVLDARVGGVIKDMDGNQRAGFEFTGMINRKDFGLNWSQITETGGLVVSNEVKIQVNAEFVAQV